MTFPPPISSSRALYHQVCALLVYQSVFDAPLGQAFLSLLRVLQHREGEQSQKATDCLSHYSHWFRLLAASGQSWQDFLLEQVLLDENPFTVQAQARPLEELPPTLIQAARHDLAILEGIYNCTLGQIIQWVSIASQSLVEVIAWDLPNRPATGFDPQRDWAEQLSWLGAHYQRRGVGIFAQFSALRWRGGGLEGVAEADPIRLADLTGYETQKATLMANTQALLQGRPALHVLLYGSRGSGKSSLVKALVNEYGAAGLRLIEAAPEELGALPEIFAQLRSRPQKFILFVDDLSFEDDDQQFKSLKRALEGTVVARPRNAVIYATSNRRHLVREFWDERPQPKNAEEISAWDSTQEKLSFADRFGLTLTFEPANQDVYLAIVRHLAQSAGLKISPDDLEFQAKQWATRQNGRSGRSARQFIDHLLAHE